MDIAVSNGHPKHKVNRKAKPAVKTAKHAVTKAERTGGRFVKRGEAAVAEGRNWLMRHPKSAVGVAVGTGLVIAAIANGKYVRATAIGLVGLLAKRFF